MNEILSIFNDYAGVISFVTLLATLYSIWYAKRNNKDSIRQQIESKEAELESINNTYFKSLTTYIGCPEKTLMEVRKKTLEKEIMKLKKRW